MRTKKMLVRFGLVLGIGAGVVAFSLDRPAPVAAVTPASGEGQCGASLTCQDPSGNCIGNLDTGTIDTSNKSENIKSGGDQCGNLNGSGGTFNCGGYTATSTNCP